MMKNYTLHVASTVLEQREVSQLRVEAYRVAYGTTLKSFDFLHWDANDDWGCVMYVRDQEGTAIASLRGILLSEQAALEQLFDIRLDFAVPCPVVALDRLVILPAHRKKGLSSLFRYHLYSASVHAPIGCLAFTINEGASRIAMQKQIGFQFAPASTEHREQSPYDNQTRVLFAHLPQAACAMATEVVRDHMLIDPAQVALAPNFSATLQQYLQIAPSPANTPI